MLYLRDGDALRLWRAFVDMYPQAEHYERLTDRALPLVVLEPL